MIDTTAAASVLVAAAAMIRLGLHKQLLVQRRSMCPACGRNSRDCRCRRG